MAHDAIYDLTNHKPTSGQQKDGVCDNALQTKLLTFDEIPTQEEIVQRAEKLANIVQRANKDAAMIGGAPYLMGPLERALSDRGIVALYSFSQRVSVEETLTDGSVVKKTVFKHMGFIEAVIPDGKAVMSEDIHCRYCDSPQLGTAALCPTCGHDGF